MFVRNMKKALYFILRNLLVYIAVMGLNYAYDRQMQPRTGFARYMPYVLLTTWFLWLIFHNAVLLSRLFFKRKYLLYTVLLIVGLICISYIERRIVIAGGVRKEHLYTVVLTTALYTLLGTCFFLAYRYIMDKKTLYQLTGIKREIELQQLKSQLNPHFLFNALNNIYSYTLQSNKFGNELILKLSELMRFIIDSSKKDHVPINDEIRFIENYIAFEKERLGDRCTIQYSRNVNHIDRDLPPLILFPFIENAFKYGTNTIQKSVVDIYMNDSDDAFNLTVKNNIVNKDMQSTKVGLPNVKRRLELLYPGNHQLNILAEDGKFIVDLTLKYNEKN